MVWFQGPGGLEQVRETSTVRCGKSLRLLKPSHGRCLSPCLVSCLELALLRLASKRLLRLALKRRFQERNSTSKLSSSSLRVRFARPTSFATSICRRATLRWSASSLTCRRDCSSAPCTLSSTELILLIDRHDLNARGGSRQT